MGIFTLEDWAETKESAVRSYCRSWPVLFDRAYGSWIYDEDGREYLDFFCGAGALNYGHNNPALKRPLIDYVTSDKITHSLDMFTVAKRDFLTALDELIMRPRQLDYRVQFPGPGGANAVEAALKLARKVTGRTQVITFTNAFHGMTLGALSVTGNAFYREGAACRCRRRSRCLSTAAWAGRCRTSCGWNGSWATAAADWTSQRP